MNKQEAERSQRKALGKGLSALLPGKNGTAAAPEPAKVSAPVQAAPKLPDQFEEFQNIPIRQISANVEQPRTQFETDKLEELAQSIRAHGILQPITVTKLGNDRYRLVAGERRMRAAEMAGLTEIPALVRKFPEDKLLEIALIENIQREDLNAIETALAFSRLIEHYSLNHEQIAERTGKDRATVTNYLRLLKLAPQVQQDLISGELSMGHARALLSISDHAVQREVAQRIVDRRLSVRETEKLVRELGEPKPEAAKKSTPEPDANVRAALEELRSALGTKVRIVPKSATTGKIEIEYYSNEDLDRIYSVIVRAS